MPSLLLPHRCLNPACPGGPDKQHDTPLSYRKCEDCGEESLAPTEIIHLLVPDSKGSFTGGTSLTASQPRVTTTKKLRILCDHGDRLYRSLPPRHILRPKHVTIVPSAATCPDCLILAHQYTMKTAEQAVK